MRELYCWVVLYCDLFMKAKQGKGRQKSVQHGSPPNATLSTVLCSQMSSIYQLSLSFGNMARGGTSDRNDLVTESQTLDQSLPWKSATRSCKRALLSHLSSSTEEHGESHAHGSARHHLISPKSQPPASPGSSGPLPPTSKTSDP